MGGSCLALGAAVRAGLGVAPVGRMVGQGMVETSAASGLPSLAASRIVTLARTPCAALTAAARALETSARDMLRAMRS